MELRVQIFMYHIHTIPECQADKTLLAHLKVKHFLTTGNSLPPNCSYTSSLFNHLRR